MATYEKMPENSEELIIIENTIEAIDEIGWAYGGYIFEITREQLDALLAGKVLAYSHEYSYFFRLEGGIVEDRES